MRPELRRRLAVLLVIVLAGAGTRLWRSHPATPAVGAAVKGATGSSVADVLQLGRLQLHGCEIGTVGMAGTAHAYCTTFKVPEDWSAANGRQIELRVAIVKSRAEKPDSDLLVFLDGGPGGAAVDDYPAIASAFREMRSRRHLLLIDQRGTGGSNELRCEARGDAAAVEKQQREQAQRAAIDRNQIDREGLQRSLRECLQKLSARADPAQYTTGNAVRDLEAVRQALGAPQLDLVGVSYGTRMAQQYAGTHPEAVRSVLLDSVVPNELVLGGETAMNLDATLKARFEVCRLNPACAARFGDPYASLYRLRDQLRAQRQKVMLRDPVTYAEAGTEAGAADLAVTARLFAYSPLTSALLPLTIDEALKGHYTPLLGQRKLITDTLNDQLTDGMGLSVACADDADLLQPRPADRNLLLGDSLVQYLLAACEVWPRGTRSANFHEPWTSRVPTLILAGEFDPITPRRYAEAVQKHLVNARLLTFKGQGHAVLGTGCMPRLAGEFVRDLKIQTLDASCLDALGDTPAFLSYGGAAP